MGLEIAELRLGAGRLGICPMPGRGGDYAGDMAVIAAWGPQLVLTMTSLDELRVKGAASLKADLAAHGIAWAHLPVADFGIPGGHVQALWPKTSAQAQKILSNGGKVLSHCMGGCGRSGTALLRLMIEAGEDPTEALGRLRAVRPCAVETPAQLAWASNPNP
jgi:protein-tyrosine phosphatase